MPDNVWLGATIVNQTEADRDIPKLLATPARMKVLSMEPLRGAVDISDWLTPSYPHCGTGFSQGEGMADGYCGTCAGHASDPIHKLGRHDVIDWVIVGGESGFAGRPMHDTWARSLRDQFSAAGVPFLFKQWGEWYPVTVDREKRTVCLPDGKEVTLNRQNGVTGVRSYELAADAVQVARRPTISIALGKKSAGRLLDGRVHDEFPQHALA